MLIKLYFFNCKASVSDTKAGKSQKPTSKTGKRPAKEMEEVNVSSFSKINSFFIDFFGFEIRLQKKYYLKNRNNKKKTKLNFFLLFW